MRCHVVAIMGVAVGLVAFAALAGCTSSPAVATRPPAAARPAPTSTHYTLPPVAAPAVVGATGARSSPAASAPAPVAATSGFEAAVATARREQKLAVIDFGAAWCGPCKTMQRTTWADPTLVAWLSSNATRAHVDIEQRADLSQRYDIGAVPTTIVLRDGQEVGRFTGTRSAGDVQSWLQGFARPGATARAQVNAPPPVRAASAAKPAPASSMTRVTVTK